MIACDNHVGNRTIEKLENHGHKIVLRAGDIRDEWWFEEAMDRGADIFISADWDIGILCNRYNKDWIQLPTGVGGDAMARFILKELRKRKCMAVNVRRIYTKDK